jgi:UDP-N-acetylglucosamine 2-epimerase (non-hydrolysing)
MVCVGTRPEVIKMAPVLHALAGVGVRSLLVTTGQHREMLQQALDAFDLEPDIDLELMRSGQTPAELTSRAVAALDGVIGEIRPRTVLVQGDTTTAFCGALAAFYRRVPIGHVEAGLRTGDRRNPFPEEVNRRLISPLADWHFCPTERSVRNLLAEGIPRAAIHLTGNTVVDALRRTAKVELPPAERALLPTGRARWRILVTLHRRETQGESQRLLCGMLRAIARRRDVEIVFPVHLSPAVRASVFAELDGMANVHLLQPLPYRPFVHLLKSADIILTDSGGIQEEAPSFGVPVLVMRETTERPEGVEAGCTRLSGTDPVAVRADVIGLLDDRDAYRQMARAANPYGDGYAAERIVRRLVADLAPRHAGSPIASTPAETDGLAAVSPPIPRAAAGERSPAPALA